MQPEPLMLKQLIDELSGIYYRIGDMPVETSVNVEALFNPDGESPNYVDVSDVEYQEEGEGYKEMVIINTMEKDQ